MGNTESETDWVQCYVAAGSNLEQSHRGWKSDVGCVGPLLASKFPIKAGQADSEGLECAEREPVIHGEHVRRHTAKL